MDEKTFVGIIFAIVAAFVFSVFVFRSGVLPIALMGGGLTSGAVYYLLRELRFALAVGAAVALIISAIGVGLMLSSG